MNLRFAFAIFMIFLFSLLKTRTGLLGGIAIMDEHLSSFSSITIFLVACCSICTGVSNSGFKWDFLPWYNFCMDEVNETPDQFKKPRVVILSICATIILLTLLIDLYCALINCNSTGKCYQAGVLQVRKVKRSMAKQTLLFGSMINFFFFLLILIIVLINLFTDLTFKNKVALSSIMSTLFYSLEPPLKIFFCFKRNQQNQKKSTKDHQNWELDQAYLSRALREAENKSVSCSLEAGPLEVPWGLFGVP